MDGIRIRERRPGPAQDPPERVAPPDDLKEESPRSGAEIGITVRDAVGDEVSEGKYDVPILIGITVGAFLATIGLLQHAEVIWGGLSLSIALGCLTHLVMGRPVFKLARAMSAESRRLRAAMTCPYCRDHLPEDAAMVCDRKGCGAFYHEECWEECRATYGGCAIYGCGSASGHPVGRFALQRRIIRLVIAATLFPPAVVKRLREQEGKSFKEVWAESRAFQAGISHSAGRSILYGIGNLAVCLAAVAALISAAPPRPTGVFLLLIAVITFVLPVVLLRVPLVGYFFVMLTRMVGAIFRDELAALARADQGTFLARLAGYKGK